uniref:Uncharacterized protein n=1 Tax=Anguilla anguilla TaxID=7936 RepID=A0A0E9UKB9_ANGAN
MEFTCREPFNIAMEKLRETHRGQITDYRSNPKHLQAKGTRCNALVLAAK